jgi:hypothetical protein
VTNNEWANKIDVQCYDPCFEYEDGSVGSNFNYYHCAKIIAEIRAEAIAEVGNNLTALMEGLEVQNIDTFISGGKVGDYRNLGKAYINSVKLKLKETRAEALKDAADRAVNLVKLIRSADCFDELTDDKLRAAITQVGGTENGN